MNLRRDLNRSDGEKYIGKKQIQESYNERNLGVDIMPNLSTELHVRRIVRETYSDLVNVKSA